jgi:hypothetical protein
VSITGTLSTTGVATFNTSTIREKDNIRPLDFDPEKFMQIAPISYIHRASGLPMDGLSAEQFADLRPCLVQFDKGLPMALAYNGVLPHAIAMIQYQHRIIRHLFDRIEALERDVRGRLN